jgi:hypothetical protein
MTREQTKAITTGLIASGLLAVLIFAGSQGLRHIDAALVGYTFACLFAVFGIAYRYSMWLQRPPTRQFWRRGWQAFLRPGRMTQRLKEFAGRVVSVFALNLFIWRRGRMRGLAHVLIMWGCLLAAAITFPLVFGWIHFETLPGDMSQYQVFVFGLPAGTFRHESLLGEFIFHGLVWSALLVIPGVLLAFRRRLRDHGAAVLQTAREDIMPLVLLFAVSVTGLLLTVSYTWMKGYGYDFLALLHAITVIFTLLWLPFGKFFHIFQRPAQLGVKFYQDVGREEPMICARCQQTYATRMHVEDLIQVERELGYQYDMPGETVGHYQRICPTCRRKMLGLAQGRLCAEQRGTWIEGDNDPMSNMFSPDSLHPGRN